MAIARILVLFAIILYLLQTNSMNFENLGSREHGGLNVGLIEPQIPVPSVQASQECNNVEQLNQTSSKRKRSKKEKRDFKCCSCQKSQCLKLYCECFANGVYCVDSCTCNACLNNTNYEDTVIDAREHIHSRNPHAFSPKVKNYPASTDEKNNPILASAWHKTGCNCKKSKCLKNYCECYEAKVGCSEVCRCDNCMNSFGKKPEPRVYKRRGKLLDKLSNEENVGFSNQFFPTCQELVDITDLNPSSTDPSSNKQLTSSNTIDYSTTLQGQWYDINSQLQGQCYAPTNETKKDSTQNQKHVSGPKPNSSFR